MNGLMGSLINWIENKTDYSNLKKILAWFLKSPPCKDSNAWFTTVPLTPFLINNVESVYLGLKVLDSEWRNAKVPLAEKPPLKFFF